MVGNTSNPYDSPAETGLPQKPLLRSPRFWIPAIVCLLTVLMVPVFFFVGGLMGQVALYSSFAERQQKRIEAYLQTDPQAFGDLEVHSSSDGWAYPAGTLHSQADYDRLSQKLHEMFGDELARKMMSNVSVESERYTP